MKLEGRVAVVTGGGSGIGRASAQLAAEGVRVCVLDVDRYAASAVAGSIGGLGLECDVSDPEQVDASFASCVEKLGSVDLALLNAGVTIRWSGDIGSLDLADYRRSVSVNLEVSSSAPSRPSVRCGPGATVATVRSWQRLRSRASCPGTRTPSTHSASTVSSALCGPSHPTSLPRGSLSTPSAPGSPRPAR